MAMSQQQFPHHSNPASAGPQQRPGHDAEDARDQPSSWNDPQNRIPGEDGASDDQHNDPVVILDDDEAPAEAYPRRRHQLPYGKGFVKSEGAVAPPKTTGRPRPRGTTPAGQTRVQILDTWMRSGLPTGDFATLVKVPKHTLYE
jgi:hypothetical protein